MGRTDGQQTAAPSLSAFGWRKTTVFVGLLLGSLTAVVSTISTSGQFRDAAGKTTALLGKKRGVAGKIQLLQLTNRRRMKQPSTY